MVDLENNMVGHIW